MMRENLNIMRFKVNKIFNGLDTETINGYCRIIAKPNEWRSVKRWDAIWDFIKGENYWTYNLRFDAEGILKYLPEEILKDKVLNKKIEFSWDRFKFVYIPGKYFGITNKLSHHKGVKMYDLTSFYNFLSLENASKSFNIPPKHDNVVVKNFINHQKDWNLEDYLNKKNNLEIIGAYCQDDADKVFKLGKNLKEMLHDILGITLDNPTSKAKITCEIMDQTGIPFPKGINHKDKLSYKFAKMTYKGGMFETYQRGIFGKCKDVDVQSAYPHKMYGFENLLNGLMIEIKSEEVMSRFKYGWLFVEHDCQYFPVKSPMPNYEEFIIDNEPFTLKYPNQSKIVYPKGTRYDFITLDEYYWLKKWNYKVKFLMGYGWRKIKDEFAEPFRWIKDVYEKRTKYPKKESPVQNSLLKIGMNGGYGKLVQRKGQSPIENFYYGSYVTAQTRLQILEFIHENNLFDLLIQIATDGILFQDDGRELKGDFTKGKLGAWEVKEFDEVFVLMNGVYQTNEKGTISTKLRGFHTVDTDLIHLLQKNRYKNEVRIPIKDKVVHMTEAIRNHNIYTKDDINKFIKVEKIIYLNNDKKRKWQNFENFDQLLEGNFKGEPYDISEVERDINFEAALEAAAIL